MLFAVETPGRPPPVAVASPPAALPPPGPDVDPFAAAAANAEGADADDPFVAAIRGLAAAPRHAAPAEAPPRNEVRPPAAPLADPALPLGARAPTPDALPLVLEEPERNAATRAPSFPLDPSPVPPADPLDFGFDFGEVPAPEAPAPEPRLPVDGEAAPGGVELGVAAPNPRPVAVAEQVRPVVAEARRAPPHAAPPAAAERSPSRSILGMLAVNALSLAALVAVAGGLVATWRPGGRAPFSGPVAALAAEEVAGVFYDTAAGKPVLVVRGQLRSSAGSPPMGAAVRVDVLDGGRVVASASGVAGVVVTPEEVFAVDSRAAAERLARALAARVAPPLHGAVTPFSAVLADLPPGAERFTVRVSVAPDPGAT
jgi:hypothetical protein